MGDNLPQWLSVGFQLAEIVGAFVGTAGGVLWFIARHSMVTRADMDKREEARDRERDARQAQHDEIHARITERFDRGEARFNQLTNSISLLPSRADLEKLNDRLGKADHATTQLAGKIESLENVLRRIEKPLDILVEAKMRGQA